ncbi:hypothetical protein E3N88_19139 [Mikania micrantha]|uniref:Uncharacterized protein n=1 Tax=Mikania micrantha TaxID=192012 RepID=A0A5N6NP97_9ASTR|nr:hypothetical protein E3N88_19139 [Mikania micrantha]
MSSFLVSVSKKVTGKNGGNGCLADNTNNGRLDLFYGLLTVLCGINFGAFWCVQHGEWDKLVDVSLSLRLLMCSLIVVGLNFVMLQLPSVKHHLRTTWLLIVIDMSMHMQPLRRLITANSAIKDHIYKILALKGMTPTKNQSVYRRAIANGLVEVLSVHKYDVLHMEQKLLSDPLPILATVTQSLNKCFVLLPPLYELILEIERDSIYEGETS